MASATSRACSCESTSSLLAFPIASPSSRVVISTRTAPPGIYGPHGSLTLSSTSSDAALCPCSASCTSSAIASARVSSCGSLACTSAGAFALSTGAKATSASTGLPSAATHHTPPGYSPRSTARCASSSASAVLPTPPSPNTDACVIVAFPPLPSTASRSASSSPRPRK